MDHSHGANRRGSTPAPSEYTASGDINTTTASPSAAEGSSAVAEATPALNPRQKYKKDHLQRVLSNNAGPILQTIVPSEVTPVFESVRWEQDPEILCCYNWQESELYNRILVPGGPPKWSPPRLPHTLAKDHGATYSDYNYARVPDDPYGPFYHALGVMNPSYQFHDTDVIADRSNLRKLLDCVAGRNNGPWRLDLHVIEDTLIIVKRDPKYRQWMDGVQPQYGHNFEKAFTRPGVGMEHATNHYRAIRYSMGPLNVVVRFEADAYYDETEEPAGGNAAPVSGGNSTHDPQFNFGAPIEVLQRGYVIPTWQMAEMKTSACKPGDQKPVSCMDQMWFGRTKHLFVGIYVPATGVMERIRHEESTERLRNWQEGQQENLRKLAGLLKQLKLAVKAEPGVKSLVLVRESSSGPLLLREMDVKEQIINDDLYWKHWGPVWGREDPTLASHQALQHGYQYGAYNGGYGGYGSGYNTAYY